MESPTKSVSAPIINTNYNNDSDIENNNNDNDNINDIIINQELIDEILNQGNKNVIPPIIKKFNTIHETPLMISTSINSLINFKNKNFRESDILRNNPNIFNLFVEYKKDYLRNFNSWFNKLSITKLENYDKFINFINNSFYNEEIIKKEIFSKIFNDFMVSFIIKDTIMESYCVLLDKLKSSNDYIYSFNFDNEFLNNYVNTLTPSDAERYNYFVNNIANFINFLDKYHLINDEVMFKFLETILLTPKYDNIEFITFCKRIINIIHGTNKENFASFGLYVASQKYLLNKNNIIEIFNNIADELYPNNKPFIFTMLIEYMINIVNGKPCCEICQKKLLNKDLTKEIVFCDDEDEDDEEDKDFIKNENDDDDLDESALTYY